MPSRLLKLSGLLTGVVLLLSACSISTTSNSNPSTAGRVESSLFVSTNQGDTWAARANIPTVSGRPRSLADVNVLLII